MPPHLRATSSLSVLLLLAVAQPAAASPQREVELTALIRVDGEPLLNLTKLLHSDSKASGLGNTEEVIHAAMPGGTFVTVHIRVGRDSELSTTSPPPPPPVTTVAPLIDIPTMLEERMGDKELPEKMPGPSAPVCIEYPCLNGGTCVYIILDVKEVPFCSCRNGFKGRQCEIIDAVNYPVSASS